jgi:hypothetical protein
MQYKKLTNLYLESLAGSSRSSHNPSMTNNKIITLNQDLDTPDFQLIKGDQVKPIKVWFTGEIYCLRVQVLSGEFQGEEADIDLSDLLGGSL